MEKESYLGPWIKAHMTSLGISAEELGNRVGVSRSAIYYYLNDKDRPRFGIITKICEVFGVPVEEATKLYSERPGTAPPRAKRYGGVRRVPK
jgi:transcriptional regulator with XRE-family HTH domain